MEQLRREVVTSLTAIRRLHEQALRTEAARDGAAVVRDGTTWAGQLAGAVRPARWKLAHLHGLGLERLTEEERPEVMRLDADFRRLGALARDSGCTLIGSEETSPERLPGDMPPEMTPD